MHIHSHIRYLLRLIPDVRLLQKCCERAGIDRWSQFLDSVLSEAPVARFRPGSQVQRALREANRVSRARGPLVGDSELESSLLPPAARGVSEPGGLRHHSSVRRGEAVTGVKVGPGLDGRRRRQSMSAREALAQLGGIAGARAVADHLTEHLDKAVSVRQVRDRFRNTGGAVRKLGAGYFATRERNAPPVLHWVESRLVERRSEPIVELVAAVLDAYPHGNARAVQAWLHQQPGVLAIRGGMVHFVEATGLLLGAP